MTKTRDDYLVDCILCNQKLAEVKEACQEEARKAQVRAYMTLEEKVNAMGSLALSEDLANDTIIIALGIAGYENVDSMPQFERASVLLDMAQELAALGNRREFDGEVWEAVAWERIDKGEGL